MFLSTSGTFHIKGPDGEPGGRGKKKPFDCDFFIFIKLKFRLFLLFPLYVGNVVSAEFTASGKTSLR